MTWSELVVLAALLVGGVCVVLLADRNRQKRIRLWWQGKNEDEMSSTYDDMHLMFADLQAKADRPRYRLRRAMLWAPRGVRDVWRYVLRFWQRGRYGWSEQDAFNGSAYISKVTAGVTGWIATNTASYPPTMTYEQWVAALKIISVEYGRHGADDTGTYRIPYGVKQSLAKSYEDVWS